MNHEVRKIPKKYIILISCFIFLSITLFFIITILKEQKFKEILGDLGHLNVSNVLVVNKLDVEDPKTKVVSNLYKIKFYDNDLEKICVGFIHQKANNMYEEDFDCKKKK